jgi:hypothetical protein
MTWNDRLKKCEMTDSLIEKFFITQNVAHYIL